MALVVGSVIGTLRTLPDSPWIVRLGNAWVEFFRNIPLLVHIFLWYHVIPSIFPAMKSLPALCWWCLPWASSPRRALPSSCAQAFWHCRGQRYAGMAMGFTTFQYYRYVQAAHGVSHHHPPLTSETMNIFKNSSVAFAVSVAELTMFAMQAQEETSRGIEVYLAVTGLYVISALYQPHHGLRRERSRVPGMIAAGGEGIDMEPEYRLVPSSPGICSPTSCSRGCTSACFDRGGHGWRRRCPVRCWR